MAAEVKAIIKKYFPHDPRTTSVIGVNNKGSNISYGNSSQEEGLNIANIKPNFDSKDVINNLSYDLENDGGDRTKVIGGIGIGIGGDNESLNSDTSLLSNDIYSEDDDSIR